MIKRRRPSHLLHIVCLLPLLLMLTACSYALQDRIRDLQPDEPDTLIVKRPPTRGQDGEPRTKETDKAGGELRRRRATSHLDTEPPRERARSTHPFGRRARPQTRERVGTFRGGGLDSAEGRISRWRPVPSDHKRTPDVDTPEWAREQAEAAEKDRMLDRKIRGICRGC